MNQPVLKHIVITIVFIAVFVLPMKRVVTPIYARVIRSSARTLVIAVGPPHDYLTHGDKRFEIDRRDFLREYFRDEDITPSGYNLLMMWMWIAAATTLPYRRRIALVILATSAAGVAETLSLAFGAAAWYRGSAAYSLSIGVEYLGGTAVLTGLATSCAYLGLLVIPAAFALAAFPGIAALGLGEK